MKNLNIGIDIDGTITSPYHYIPYLNKIYSKNLTEKDITTVYWADLYGDTLEGLLDKLHSDYLHSYSEAVVLDEVDTIIKELHKENELFFITARDVSLRNITFNWLEENNLSCVPLYLLGSDHKLDLANELGCDIFIEDNPNNALQLANGGIKVLLIDTNYNKDIDHINITRVSNWYEIKNIICKL